LFRDVAELLRVFFPVREFDTVLLRIFPGMSGIFPAYLRVTVSSTMRSGIDSKTNVPPT
jgi:hypothetical protein